MTTTVVTVLTTDTMTSCLTSTSELTTKVSRVAPNTALIIAISAIDTMMHTDIKPLVTTIITQGANTGSTENTERNLLPWSRSLPDQGPIGPILKKGLFIMRLHNSVGGLAILVAIFLAGPAFAHPKLESATPAADISVVASPKEVKLNFSEGIIAKFSGLELKDESGRAVTTGDPVVDPKDPKQLVVPVPTALGAGRYTVTWHAVSEDTHKVSGDYSFRVISEGAPPSQIKNDEPRDGSDGSGAKRVTKEDGSKECVCKDEERSDRVRERSRDRDRDFDRPDRSNDRNSGNREGYRERSSDRYESRGRPDCVVDDDGARYCRVR